MSKRDRLELILKQDFNISDYNFMEIEYNPEFDYFLYEMVGYEKLHNYTNGLFVTPYSATSLREYYATGFEEYFIGSTGSLKVISPALYAKINELASLEVQ